MSFIQVNVVNLMEVICTYEVHNFQSSTTHHLSNNYESVIRYSYELSYIYYVPWLKHLSLSWILKASHGHSIKWLVAWLVVVVVIKHTNTDSIVFDNLSEVIVYYSSTSRIKVMPKIQA